VPQAGEWVETINSDLAIYGGSDLANGTLHTSAQSAHHQQNSVMLTLPPLSTVMLTKVAV
jgi:1,4-alpha-glucan branching enzyme